jgi:hypothetical protein
MVSCIVVGLDGSEVRSENGVNDEARGKDPRCCTKTLAYGCPDPPPAVRLYRP